MRCAFLSIRNSGYKPFIRYTYEHLVPLMASVDVLYFPPVNEKLPTDVIVFFPGNPGLVNYYIPFLTTLQKLISPSTALITLSHVGHCPSLAHPKHTLSLDEQANAKVEFVKNVLEELKVLHMQEEEEDNELGRVGLMGHSVGSEIAVLVDQKLRVERYSDDNNTPASDPIPFGLFLLFPTLSNIARTPNGVRLSPLFRAPLIQVVPWLSILLQPLLYVLLIIAKVSKGNSSIYAPNETTLSFLLSPRTISHVLRLAASEMKSITDPDMTWYSKERERIWTYWGNGDGWVGKQGDDLKVVLRGTQGHVEEDTSESSQVVDCVDNVPHAFCLAHSDVIATKVADWINAFSKRP